MVDGEFVELVKIQQKGDKINLYMENYNSNRSSVWRYGGSGYCRASQIAITYFPLDKSKPNIGVFSLRNSSTPNGEILLAGVFTQLIDWPDHELQTISQYSNSTVTQYSTVTVQYSKGVKSPIDVWCQL